MTDPKRLLNSSPNGFTREILRAGLEEAPPGLSKARARRALGLGSIAGITATASSKAASGLALKASTAAGHGVLVGTPSAGIATKTLGAVVLKWVVVGALGGIAASGAAALVHSRSSRLDPLVASQTAPSNVSRPPTASHVAAPVHPTAAGSSSGVESAPRAMMLPQSARQERSSSENEVTRERISGASSPEFVSTPAARSSATALQAENLPGVTASAPVRKGASRSSNTLVAKKVSPALLNANQVTTGAEATPDMTAGAELDIVRIDAARAALRLGDAARAMQELDRYEQSRKSGVLEREARLLRISALVLRGEAQRARELARAYVAEFPADPHTSRLRELLRGTP